jgi:hypothetical protein
LTIDIIISAIITTTITPPMVPIAILLCVDNSVIFEFGVTFEFDDLFEFVIAFELDDLFNGMFEFGDAFGFVVTI